MLSIELKELRAEKDPVIQYLRSKLKGTITLRGSQLIVQEAKAHEVKQLLNKFLHHKGLEGFRVVSPGVGVLEVHKMRAPEARAEPEGNPPPPSVSVPYYFPSSSGSSMLFPERKRQKRKS